MRGSSVSVLPWRLNAGGSILVAVICLVVVAGGILAQPELGWAGILTGALYGLMLALGGSMFAALSAATGGRWCAPLGAAPAVVGRTLLAPAIVLVLTFVLGLQSLYSWARPEVMEANHLLHGKSPWLNAPFFLARAGIVLLVFLGATSSLFRAASSNTLPSKRSAVIFILSFALCISVGSWDWVMSLEPEWFSTMFGVYAFAGIYQGGIAAVTIVALLIEKRGGPRVTSPQLHDLGKLLFAFSMFWAYIWYCQYMLIWYAHIPEETSYFATRQQGGWAMLFWLNPIVNFVIPCVILLPARTKKHASTLFQVAGIVLAGRWLDAYLMVTPSTGAPPSFPFYGLAATVVVLLGMLWLGQRTLNQEDPH